MRIDGEAQVQRRVIERDVQTIAGGLHTVDVCIDVGAGDPAIRVARGKRAADGLGADKGVGAVSSRREHQIPGSIHSCGHARRIGHLVEGCFNLVHRRAAAEA